MSKCGGHWEWSLPGSLSFSMVLLCPTPSQQDGSAILRGHVSHERYTVSSVEGQEINLHRPIPRTLGIEPRAAAWQARTLPLALLQPSQNRGIENNSRDFSYLTDHCRAWVARWNHPIGPIPVDAWCRYTSSVDGCETRGGVSELSCQAQGMYQCSF